MTYTLDLSYDRHQKICRNYSDVACVLLDPEDSHLKPQIKGVIEDFNTNVNTTGVRYNLIQVSRAYSRGVTNKFLPVTLEFIEYVKKNVTLHVNISGQSEECGVMESAHSDNPDIAALIHGIQKYIARIEKNLDRIQSKTKDTLQKTTSPSKPKRSELIKEKMLSLDYDTMTEYLKAFFLLKISGFHSSGGLNPYGNFDLECFESDPKRYIMSVNTFVKIAFGRSNDELRQRRHIAFFFKTKGAVLDDEILSLLAQKINNIPRISSEILDLPSK